jgi:hypothetical protein
MVVGVVVVVAEQVALEMISAEDLQKLRAAQV